MTDEWLKTRIVECENTNKKDKCIYVEVSPLLGHLRDLQRLRELESKAVPKKKSVNFWCDCLQEMEIGADGNCSYCHGKVK